MTAEQVVVLLIGKEIKEIKHAPYAGWPMCIEEIIFTDGTVLELGGDASEARFDGITFPDGTYQVIK